MAARHEPLCGVMRRERSRESPEVVDLLDALAKLSAGRRFEVDAIRMLELYELFRDAGQVYWAAMAARIATLAVRPDH